MKKFLLSLAALLAMVSCSNNDETIDNKQPQAKELLSRKEINAKIKSSLEKTGDFNWMSQDARTIWSAVSHGNNLLTIGYGTSEKNIAKNSESENVKEALIALVKSNEPTLNLAKGSTDIYVNEYVNYLDIKVTNIETINVLLNDKRVRYIEPAAYKFEDAEVQARFSSSSSSSSGSSSGSGCGYSEEILNYNDYRTITPGARVPWSFDAHNIPQAWNYSTGAGITLAVVDTGLSPVQSLMNQNFNDGYSSGRTVQKYGTFVDSDSESSNNYDGFNDKCGHGTSMASVATAPRNNNNLPVGVAYNANLVTYRAVEDVLINDYHEKRGVVEALTALANRSDVKVISMSIGSPFSIGNVSDAVRYAYSRGKMIVAAGGTSTSFTTWYGVIFPASMSETVAVTGVIEGQYDECDVCHTGSKIDFTVQMQRSNGTDNTVPVLSYYNLKADYVGGSSVATATTAGIAALIWSKNPSWSRAQVLQKMKESADYYPNKHSDYGYGNINALSAVQ